MGRRADAGRPARPPRSHETGDPCETIVSVDPEDHGAFLSMLIDQATTRVDRQGSLFFEGHDAKALALFEFNLGAIALLAAFAPTEHAWIWLAEIPFAISGALFLRALALKGFHLGPQLEAFQDEH